MKIALFGGSFDPIHMGHLAAAKAVYKALNLDLVLFIPVGKHPLKQTNYLFSFEERFSFLEKSLLGFPNFEPSRLDEDSGKFSYTSDLVRRVKGLYPTSELFFLAGTDIVYDLNRWHEWEWLLDNIQFVIVSRNTPEVPLQKPVYYDKLLFVEMEPVDVSATEIRRRIKSGEDVRGIVPEEIVSELELLLVLFNKEDHKKRKKKRSL